MDNQGFQRDENFKCDAYHGHNFNFDALNETKEMSKRLSYYFIEYKECGHKICFHCIEKKSKNHSCQPKDIPCRKCELIEKNNKQEEEVKKVKYCSCEDGLEYIRKQREAKEEIERRKTPEQKAQERFESMQALNYKVYSMFMGYSGFPSYEPTCNSCKKVLNTLLT